MSPSTRVSIGMLAALTVAACRHPVSPYVGSRCPLPPGARGFPLTASSSAVVDSELLRAVARAIAGQWTTHPKRLSEADVEMRATRALNALLYQGETFMRDDWTPMPSDTAQLVIVYRSGGALPEIRLARSGPPTATESLLRYAATTALEQTRDRQPLRDALPLTLPATAGDSVAVLVALGREPGNDRSGVARFSVQQRHVSPTSGNRPPPYPAGAFSVDSPGDVTLAFVVRTDSTADLSTARVIRSTGGDFARAVLGALATYRYVPAQIDCVVVPELVQQPFSFQVR